MSFLGVDFGTKIIGLAIAQSLSKKISAAGPIVPIKNVGREGSFKDLCRICEEYQIETVVFGLPHLKDGAEGPLAKRIRDFAEAFVVYLRDKLLIQKVELAFVDESLTSFEAGRYGFSTLANPKKNREYLNSLAAVLILETYLSLNQKT